MKTATCKTSVPAVLNPTGAELKAGTVIEYFKVVFRNGEHHLVLANKTQVPAVFFDF